MEVVLLYLSIYHRLSSVNIGALLEVTIGDNLTIAGNLIVQGDTVQQQVANLKVKIDLYY